MRRGWAVVAVAAALAGCGRGEDPVPLELVPIREAAPKAAAPAPVNPVRGARMQAELPKGKARRAVVMAKLRAASVAAEHDLLDGYFTGQAFNFGWRPGGIYTVIGAAGMPTTFGMMPGEGYNTYALDERNRVHFKVGDTWTGTRGTREEALGPAASRVTVIPFEPGRCARLHLYTTWRLIQVNFCSTGTRDAYNSEVTFHVPEDERLLFEAGILNEAVPMDPAVARPVDRLDSGFAFEGPASFRPNEWSAMTDGIEATYLIPPRGLGFLPVPYLVGSDGKGETASYRVLPKQDRSGTYIEVTRTPAPATLVLQHGTEAMTVRRVRP